MPLSETGRPERGRGRPQAMLNKRRVEMARADYRCIR